MRVMLAGGGTGGHVFPALAVLDALRQADPALRAAYVGTRRGLEARLLADMSDVRFFPLSVRGWMRRGVADSARTALRLAVGFVQAAWALLRFRPNVVIGVGGYSSFPPVLLAAVLGRCLPIYTVIHEQNVAPGLANRWLARWVDAVFVAYPEAAARLGAARRIVVTGTPIREDLLRAERGVDAYKAFGLDPERRTILVVGGSLGSADLVSQILAGREALSERNDIQVLLATGTLDAAHAARRALAASGVHNVIVVPFIEQMAAALAVADVVVSRGGATMLAEIAGCGKASVIVPWRDAAEDHQSENARALERASACRIPGDDVLQRSELVSYVLDLIDDGTTLADLARNARHLGRADAGRRIQAEIQTLVKGAQA